MNTNRTQHLQSIPWTYSHLLNLQVIPLNCILFTGLTGHLLDLYTIPWTCKLFLELSSFSNPFERFKFFTDFIFAVQLFLDRYIPGTYISIHEKNCLKKIINSNEVNEPKLFGYLGFIISLEFVANISEFL